LTSFGFCDRVEIFYLRGDFIFSLTHILLSIPGVFIAVAVHEYAKSLVAYRLGDTGVKEQGRLTLNPIKHMDILGSIFMAVFGYGWANPVKLSPFSFQNRKKSLIIIFITGFLTSLAVGGIFALAAHLYFDFMWQNLAFEDINFYILWGLSLAARLNIGFALLNLLPIHPLNGSFLISGLTPETGVKIAQAEKILQLILALFIVFGGVNFFFGRIINIFLPIPI
jgi:Zn-dependent protease